MQAHTKIKWTPYGKVDYVDYDVDENNSPERRVSYGYDAMQNRVVKSDFDRITNEDRSSYYFRDAQGNVMAIYERDASGTIKWKEQHLYGSSRLGILQPDVEWAADELPEEMPHYANTGLSLEGWKRYELSNHLSNVLSVVNDRKSYVDDDEDGVADYYEPAILSATDYYPFGMAMAGRTFSTPDYRYGFNGKEKDKDLNGDLTHYDYGFRIYNAGIGKFLSVDPLAKYYPAWSPYPFAMNRPIDGVDLDGLEYLDAEVYFNTLFGDDVALQQELSENLFLNAFNHGDVVAATVDDRIYLWVGQDYSNSDGEIVTTWLNEGLSVSEQTDLQNYYTNYDQSARRRANECHTAGCCIDCFNGAVNELHGIGEDELDDSGVPGHPQTIDHTLNVLEGRELAASIGSFSPNLSPTGMSATGFDGVEEAILNSTGEIRGVYFFGVSIGNGYHSTSLILDYTDPDNPIYYFGDQGGRERYTDFDDIIEDKYISYTNGALSTYQPNSNVNLNISKIDSEDTE